MSAEMYDGESAGALALPAVDILPVKAARKTKGGEVEQAPAPLLEASPEGWATPAPPAPVNPWTGAPAEPALAAYPPPVADPGLASFPPPAPDQTPAQAAAHVPMPAPVLVPIPPAAYAAAPVEAPKKFFGMAVRRPKKSDAPADGPVEQNSPPTGYPAPVPAPPSAYEAVVAPVAAWPTDVGVSAVAGAEPTLAAGGYAAPASYAPFDLLSGAPADSAPHQAAAEPTSVTAAPAPVETAPADTAPVETAAVATVDTGPVVVPVPEAPAAPVVDAAEVASLRAQLGASESGRMAAENRADQAVAYGQQTQARLQQLEADGQARIQAAETKSRSAANEAQDWQIRHREAEATIAELAATVASAEKRMAELRTERDDLAAALDQATAPEHHAPTV